MTDFLDVNLRREKAMLTVISVGDVVVLKSDGPLMTVTHVDEDVITCCWFDDEDQLAEAEFDARCLLPVVG